MPIQGALIGAVDHNNVQQLLPKSIARILGDRIAEFPTSEYPDSATYGYGQGLISSSRGIDQIVLAEHMAALKIDLLKIAAHCGVSDNPLITGLPSIVSGNLIENEHFDAYEAALEFLKDYRFEVAEGQYSLESTVPNISHSRTAAWGETSSYVYTYENTTMPSTIRHSFTLDFGNPQNARYFFNSGGQVRFSASRTGGGSTYQNQSWTNLLSSMGTIAFDYQKTQSTGSGTGSSIGFYQLTNTPQQLFTKNGGSVYVYAFQYAANDYTITAHTDVANNQFGTARYIYFNVYLNDDHTRNGNYQYHYTYSTYRADVVDGTVTSNVTLKRATGPNVSVSTPVAINTRLLSS